MAPLIDPRLGDIEDDASSTKRRSLLGIAGSLLAEISLPKLFFAWVLLIAVPGVLLGLAPLAASAWLSTLSRTMAAQVSWVWLAILVPAVIGFGWIGGRRLFRMVEQAFWSLNSLAVQPGYAFFREALRHLTSRLSKAKSSPARRARLQAASAAGGGVIVCALALIAIGLAWPYTRWVGGIADFASPVRLILPALANTVVIVGAYLAGAALVWGLADATMDQPRDLAGFDTPPKDGRTWRIAHLSDTHGVGERYGFRIESGRSGPRGNERFARVLARLDALHAEEPLDLVLITGDMTDAGLSTEWAEFFAALAEHPAIVERTLILPGNHDLSIVDRANPARLDLPTSPRMRLRQMRTLSAMAALQGDKVWVVDPSTRRLGKTLSEALAPHREVISAFADAGSFRLSVKLAQVWADAFPMVLPPETSDGLGVVLLNSVAETHFSFTNALGLVSAEQAWKLAAVVRHFPRARWIVALHHHLVEYPTPAKAFSERIGTALVNGSWFVRQLGSIGERIVAMHGHRHIDWIGECGGIRIVSAPSPVMEATDDEPTTSISSGSQPDRMVAWACSRQSASTSREMLREWAMRSWPSLDRSGRVQPEKLSMRCNESVGLTRAAAAVIARGTVAYPAGAEVRFEEVGKARISVEMLGRSGPVVVFISGTDEEMSGWARVAKPLSACARVFLYDRPGTGASPLRRDTGALLADTAVDELAVLLGAVELPPPYILVGHSLGGLYAQAFARDRPGEVKAVVLVDAASPFEPPGTFVAKTPPAPASTAAIEEAGFQPSVRAMLSGPSFPPVPLIVLAATDHGETILDLCVLTRELYPLSEVRLVKPLYEFVPDPDVVLDMDVETLATILLQIASGGLQNGMFHPNNMTTVTTGFGFGSLRSPYERRADQVNLAVSEAWDWLRSSGYVVPREGMNGQSGWLAIFRKGADALRSGQDLGRLRESHLRVGGPGRRYRGRLPMTHDPSISRGCAHSRQTRCNRLEG